MGSVWKRLQRVNKRAAKFQFTSSYHELRVETTAKWRPTNLSVVWTRRSRRVASAPLPWDPDMVNPLVGHISWPVPDNHTISVTLFKDPRTHELEDKDWTFVIEDISQLGKKRVLASASINMRKYASIEPTQQSFTLNLKPVSRKITSAELELTISCVFLREGKATDEDMQSVVSLMSVNNNCDVAPLDDLEDIPDLESSGDLSEHVLDFTQQLEQLTSSLHGTIDLATPMSVPSLSEDPTPLAENNHLYLDELELDKQETQKTPVDPNYKITKSNEEVSNNASPLIFPSPLNEIKHEDEMKNSLLSNKSITNRKSIDELDKEVIKLNQELNNKENVDSVTKRNEHISKRLADLNKISNEEKIEVIVSEIPTKNNEKKEEIQINIISGTEKSTKELQQQQVQIQQTSHTVSIQSSQNLFTNIPKVENKERNRPELQPLKLKKNYENDNSKIMEKSSITTKERTPGQDLLEWCKEVTKDYPNIKVTNLTTSWRNGMAFCAIIHYFESNLIDMSKLSPHDVVGNCRMAFDAAESLGIPRVIEPRDMSLLAVPDKLAVMTYLHQLRAHFTGKQLQIEQIGQTSDESSYVIGNYKTDNLSQDILNLSHLKAHLQHQNSLEDEISSENRSPTQKKDVKNLILSGSKNLLVKVLSPAKDKNNINMNLTMQNNLVNRNNMVTGNNENKILNNETKESNKPILMTRRELTDPFGSDDDEDDNKNNEQTQQQQRENNHKVENNSNSAETKTVTPTLDPTTATKLISRHKEMSEKAKAMMERLKSSSIDNGKGDNDEERQQRLREHARRLIAETRLKSMSLDSPTSPIKPITQRITLSPERTISPINNTEGFVFNQINGSNLEGSPLKGSPTKISKDKLMSSRDNQVNQINKDYGKLNTSQKIERNGNSPLQSFNTVLDRISPKNEKRGDQMSYIESEMEALEREQEAIDQKASSLEKKLRAVMGGNSKTEETEEQLLSQWFTLVNKKNALLRRQMQLNILEQENDLERKYALLNQELRAALSVEDWRKSEAQREREALLLAELVAIVDKRDQLVQHLHSQEKAIEDDDEIERELEHVDISSKEKCVIQ